MDLWRWCLENHSFITMIFKYVGPLLLFPCVHPVVQMIKWVLLIMECNTYSDSFRHDK